MIKQNGTVIAVEPGRVWVETISESSCKGCAAKGACGTSVVSKIYGERRHHLPVQSTLEVAEGDRVVIGMPEETLLQASFVVYLLPLVLLIAGAGVGQWLVNNDAGSLSGAIMGAASGFFIARTIAARRSGSQSWQPVLLGRCESDTVISEVVPVQPAGGS